MLPALLAVPRRGLPLALCLCKQISFSLQVALTELPCTQYLNKDLKLWCYPDVFKVLSPLMLFSVLSPPFTMELRLSRKENPLTGNHESEGPEGRLQAGASVLSLTVLLLPSGPAAEQVMDLRLPRPLLLTSSRRCGEDQSPALTSAGSWAGWALTIAFSMTRRAPRKPARLCYETCSVFQCRSLPGALPK